MKSIIIGLSLISLTSVTQNLNANEGEDLQKQILQEICELPVSEENFEMDEEERVTADVSYSLTVESVSVHTHIQNGYKFHIADYYNGTRIVTCLNGSMKGLQGVSSYGNKVAESSNVEWHSSYFIHYYPDGRVESYPNKQYMKVY